MPDSDRYDSLRERAKDVRRHAKATLLLLDALEGVERARELIADEELAEDVNLELSYDGEILFALDVSDLPSLREDLGKLLERATGELEEALSQAEQDLA